MTETKPCGCGCGQLVTWDQGHTGFLNVKGKGIIWQGCYDLGWQGEIVPEAFTHPAKFSRALIRRIYEHALKEGWLEPGMTVVDPFAGVGLGALDAQWHGLQWVGVELEPKFIALSEQNLALWQRKYGSKEGWGSARIIQRDSRRLAEVIQGADVVCSSPPYVSGGHHTDVFNAWNVNNRGQGIQKDSAGYGSSLGQLGAMKEGDFDMVVSSPPFNAQMNSGGSGTTNFIRDQAIQTGRDPDSPSRTVLNQSKQWPQTEGQLASLPEGRFEAVISSPPYEGSMNSEKHGIDWTKTTKDYPGRVIHQARIEQHKFHHNHRHYGKSDGQLGAECGPTFWSASREIVAQCYAILKPYGHTIWVCKDFIRKGKRVPFSDRWQALCESVGFRLVCRHRAMLVTTWEEETLFGVKFKKKDRKSFFRRLTEKKGNPPIDWEDVLCLER